MSDLPLPSQPGKTFENDELEVQRRTSRASGGGHDPILPRHPSPAFDLFVPKASSVWAALEAKFGQQLQADVVDYLYAHYVFGLTTPFHGEDDPAIHVQICRQLLSLKLPAERVGRALHHVPDDADAGMVNAFQSIESLGLKDGAALYEQLVQTLRDVTDNDSGPAAGVAHTIGET